MPPSPRKQLAKSGRELFHAAAVVLVAAGTAACDPEFVVGVWECPAPQVSSDDAASLPIPTSWSTGFETGSCDYTRRGSFCYAAPGATFDFVARPTHSGQRAAAFSITTAGAADGEQTRCVLQGKLPEDARYGAWVLIPEAPVAVQNWNLFHLQGGQPGNWHGLWDVSIDVAADGTLNLYLFDAINGGNFLRPDPPVALPVGSWSHVELRLRRSSDPLGEVGLYQDSRPLVTANSLITDDSQSAQWYVGNLAAALTPATSTLFIDDVSVRSP